MEQAVTEAVRILREGGVILYPTDTVWGIGCDATNAEAAAGSLSTATITPANLAFALPTLVPPASASTAGRTAYATNAQAAAAAPITDEAGLRALLEHGA